jgi:ankyrin repeat protein
MTQLVDMACADDQLKSALDSIDNNGLTLLHYCSMYNLSSLTTMMLTRGASVNERTQCGTTALHLACGFGHVNVVRILLRAGAQVDSCDSFGYTALQRAILAHRNEVVQLFASELHVDLEEVERKLISNSKDAEICPLFR